MNEITELRAYKKITATIYLLQVCSFLLAGIPLLVGVLVNFLHKNDVLNTWLESHFDWQIKTAWITLAGFAISGITFELGVGLYVLISTIIYLVFRIVVGWNALNDNKAIGEEN